MRVSCYFLGVTCRKLYILDIGLSFMAKIDYKPRILDDRFVKDGLCAVSTLDDNPSTERHAFVVGGMATQSYLPTSTRRETADIDLAVLRPLSYAEFKDFSGSVQEYLADQGYSVTTGKGSRAYHLYFEKGGQACVVEFARRNKNNFKRIAKRLEREMENSRSKVVEGRESTYRVSSPEDIVIPKIVRGIGSLKRNPSFGRHVGSQFKRMSDKQIQRELQKIQELRQEAVIHVGDPSLAERLRFVSDAYDVRILSEVAGFNENYLETAMGNWQVLVEPSIERDRLMNYLLPSLGNF